MDRTDTIRQVRLLHAAHLRHLYKINQYNGNIGWVVTDDAFLSKTRGGIIQTKRLAPRKYEHSIVRED